MGYASGYCAVSNAASVVLLLGTVARIKPLLLSCLQGLMRGGQQADLVQACCMCCTCCAMCTVQNQPWLRSTSCTLAVVVVVVVVCCVKHNVWT